MFKVILPCHFFDSSTFLFIYKYKYSHKYQCKCFDMMYTTNDIPTMSVTTFFLFLFFCFIFFFKIKSKLFQNIFKQLFYLLLLLFIMTFCHQIINNFFFNCKTWKIIKLCTLLELLVDNDNGSLESV